MYGVSTASAASSHGDRQHQPRPAIMEATATALTGAAHQPSSSGARPPPGPISSQRLHQPLGPPDQDHRHQQVDADAAELGEEHLAEGVDETDEQRRDQRPVIEPMPPMTTTTKQMMSTLAPMPG